MNCRPILFITEGGGGGAERAQSRRPGGGPAASPAEETQRVSEREEEYIVESLCGAPAWCATTCPGPGWRPMRGAAGGGGGGGSGGEGCTALPEKPQGVCPPVVAWAAHRAPPRTPPNPPPSRPTGEGPPSPRGGATMAAARGRRDDRARTSALAPPRGGP